MKYEVRHQPASTFSYVAWDSEARHTAVIGPALNYDQGSGPTATTPVQQLVYIVHDQGLTVDWIPEALATLGHTND